MMKKGLNIILIIIVIAIYAKAFWPVKNGNVVLNVPNIHTNENLRISKEFLKPQKLDYNFRDPFLDAKHTVSNKVTKSKAKNTNFKPKAKPKKNATIQSTPNIIYKGRIFNPSKNQAKGLISFNNKESIIQINDSISGYKVIEIKKTELIIKSKNHHATIKKN